MRRVASFLIVFLIIVFMFFINYNRKHNQGLNIVSCDFQSLNGEMVKLKDNKVGYYLLYFGFTKCPDVCPRVLSKMNHILHDLNISSKVAQSYFITLDIERDNVDDIKDFLKPYDNFIGLIPKNIIYLKQIKEEMGVYAEKMTYAEYFQDNNLKDDQDSSKGRGEGLKSVDKSLKNEDRSLLPKGEKYLINHTSVVYILDHMGRVVHVVNPDLDEKKIKHILHKYILHEDACCAC